MTLDRNAILSIVPSLAREEVPVPEWSGSVFVRVMTGTERDRFEILTAESKRTNFRAILGVFTICDSEGKRLFTEADIGPLGNLPAGGMVRIADVALRLNKVSQDEVEDLEKKSESGPSEDSS